MPTFTASTPCSISASVPAAVATLPATSSHVPELLPDAPDDVEDPLRVPMGGVDDEHVDAGADQRGRTVHACPSRRRSAAPQRRRPSGSFEAFGYLTAFWMSLTVISPFSRKERSTTSSFSTLWRWRISRAASSVVPTGTVMRFSLVMMSEIGRCRLVSKRRSRLVRMPTSRPSLLPSSVIGTPEMRYFFISSSASKMRWAGESVIGSTIMPLSERFTRSTSDACSSIERFL